MTSHHITSHVANNHINSPQITSETTTLLRQTNTLFESSEQRFNQSKSSEPFYRHMFCWFIYTLPFWNFRHRLVRYYWYIYSFWWKARRNLTPFRPCFLGVKQKDAKIGGETLQQKTLKNTPRPKPLKGKYFAPTLHFSRGLMILEG